MTPTIERRRSDVPALDGWRGLAIMLVLFGHFGGDQKVGWCSTLGVNLFFALSGRLMADILFLQRTTLTAFFTRRFVRIYPTLVAFVLIAMVLTHSTPIGFAPETALLALTFTLNYAVSYGYPFTTLDHIWSLCVEEHSYILLAVVALVCRRLHVRGAACLLLAIGAAAILNAVIQLDFYNRDPFEVLWRTDTAMAGILVAAGFRLLVGADEMASGSRWMAPLAILGAIVARAFGASAFVYFGVTGLLLGIAAARIEGAWSPLRALFETKTLQFFGRCSFSLYLWQEPFYRLIHQDVIPPVVFMFLAVVTGLLGYCLLEQPLRAGFGALMLRRNRSQHSLS